MQNFRIVAFAAAAAVAAYLVWPNDEPRRGAGKTEVAMPRLSPVAEAGREAFNTHCAQCHGENGAGSDNGPPLIHVIYEPSHHGDAAFFLAVRQGVRAHHWSFGDMAPVEGVREEEIVAIITFVREVQRANGID